ncbi:MAG: S1C family serine protease [Oscillospiraceae bacterium]|jgi:serine protease Do|nr:S1C family serine protease [Oscillospiraceae bacterium]
MKHDENRYSDGYIEYPANSLNRFGGRATAVIVMLCCMIVMSAVSLVVVSLLPSANAAPGATAPVRTPIVPTGVVAAPIDGTSNGVELAPIRIAPRPSGFEALSYGEIYSQCSRFVAAVSAQLSGRVLSHGTGIVVSADGLILTCSHLIDGADEISVALSSGEVHIARIAATDSVSDLALLKIAASELTPAEFTEVSNVGDTMLLLGNPLNHTLLLTDGILSGIVENAIVNGYPMTIMTTNAIVESGHSGAPLLNLHGQVVGVANSRMRVAGTGATSVNYVLPAQTVKRVIDDLSRYGKVPGRPSLGVVIEDLPISYAVFSGLPEGAHVSRMQRSAVAIDSATALILGDIITAIDGVAVRNVTELMSEVNRRKVGDEVELAVWRRNAELTVSIALTEF